MREGDEIVNFEDSNLSQRIYASISRDGSPYNPNSNLGRISRIMGAILGNSNIDSQLRAATIYALTLMIGNHRSRNFLDSSIPTQITDTTLNILSAYVPVTIAAYSANDSYSEARSRDVTRETRSQLSLILRGNNIAQIASGALALYYVGNEGYNNDYLIIPTLLTLGFYTATMVAIQHLANDDRIAILENNLRAMEDEISSLTMSINRLLETLSIQPITTNSIESMQNSINSLIARLADEQKRTIANFINSQELADAYVQSISLALNGNLPHQDILAKLTNQDEDLINKIIKSKNDLDQEQILNNELSDENRNLKRNNHNLCNELNQLKEKISQIKNDLRNEEEKSKNFENKLQLSNQALVEQEEENSDLQAKLEIERQEKNSATTALKNQTKQMHSLQEEIIELKTKLRTLEENTKKETQKEGYLYEVIGNHTNMISKEQPQINRRNSI